MRASSKYKVFFFFKQPYYTICYLYTNNKKNIWWYWLSPYNLKLEYFICINYLEFIKNVS